MVGFKLIYCFNGQELKGNIRVFCRVRPLLPDDGVETTVVSYPTSTEAAGRGIDLSQSGMKTFLSAEIR